MIKKVLITQAHGPLFLWPQLLFVSFFSGFSSGYRALLAVSPALWVYAIPGPLPVWLVDWDLYNDMNIFLISKVQFLDLPPEMGGENLPAAVNSKISKQIKATSTFE